jgi:hypothetical protein
MPTRLGQCSPRRSPGQSERTSSADRTSSPALSAKSFVMQSIDRGGAVQGDPSMRSDLDATVWGRATSRIAGQLVNLAFACLACALLIAGCAHPPRYDLMSAQAVCDTVTPPLRPGERLGGTLPIARRPGLDSVVVIGTVLEAGSGRPLPGASVGLLPASAPDQPFEPLAQANSNTEAGFVIVAPRSGRYSLVARRIGYAPARRDVALTAGEVATVRLEMRYHHCLGY